MARAQRVLGVALGSQVLRVAEIISAESRVGRAAEFRLPAPNAFNDPAALGRNFAEFLKQNGFTAQNSAFGLPAQWLMFKQKSLPAAPKEALAQMLVLQAEHEFSLEPDALALDFIPAPAAGGTQSIALYATPRARVDQLKAFALAAGLKLHVLTSTALALHTAAKRPSLIYFGNGGVECVYAGPDGLPRLRYIASSPLPEDPAAAAIAEALPGQLRRALALGETGPQVPLAWDDLGLASSVAAQLAPEFQISVARGPHFEGFFPDKGGSDIGVSGATALALQFLREPANAIDFLHSRTFVKPPSRLTSKVLWSSAATVLACLALGYLFYDWRRSTQELADMRETLDGMSSSAEDAKRFVARYNTSGGWFDQRPNYLECLRAVTLCFPDDGRVWSSSLTLNADMKGVLTGRATDEKSVLDVLDRMKESRSIGSVKMIQIRGGSGRSTDVTFSIQFLFLELEPKPADLKSPEPKVLPAKPAESKPTEPKPTEAKSAEPIPTEPKSEEPKPAESKTPALEPK